MPKQHNRVIIASLARGNFYRPLKSLIDSIILLLQLQGHNYIINFAQEGCHSLFTRILVILLR